MINSATAIRHQEGGFPNAGAKRSGATCHMAMPQCCYLAKGAKMRFGSNLNDHKMIKEKNANYVPGKIGSCGENERSLAFCPRLLQ